MSTSASSRPRVALLVTCLVDLIYPEIGAATVRLLRRAGYAVEFPMAQTCCGQPFFNSGFWDEARQLARRVVEIFEPYDYVVLPSGSCTAMVRVEYPHLFEAEPEWQERARRLAAKTYELSEFLTRVAGWQPPPSAAGESAAESSADRRVTYHDSCHMNRLLGLREEPRSLLQAAGVEVAEMAESDRCCGFGGLFSVRMPEVSNAMTAEKLRQAGETGARTVVTCDPGCLMQMRGLAGDAVRVEHLATVLWSVVGER
ncbi:MAG: (Fe-S)-binding protein [Caldilineales bacterium]|nr:(Fe-S)-binding protein [Caldilineales bacterium]MDW8319567.1 (Fe-S)-binding protein [Anaerolineae bacterium]